MSFPVGAQSLSCVRLCDPMDCRQPEFPRPEYWSGLPFSSPGDLPNPKTEPMSLVSPELAGGFFTNSATWEAHSAGTTQMFRYLLNGNTCQGTVPNTD